MTAPTTNTSDTYTVTCHACGGAFDALRAQWCECIAPERTFACPMCGACLCAAPMTLRDRFWADAPPLLWSRWRQVRSPSRVPASVLAFDPSRATVLVVDDEPKIREIAALTIRGLGLNVALAANGVECLEKVKSCRPRVVLTDALMPKMDGREVCRRLKEDPATAAIKVIVMTGVYVNPRYGVEARAEFHADDYLCKPVTPAAIEAALARHLSLGVRAQRLRVS